jgi:hypothetical protein
VIAMHGLLWPDEVRDPAEVFPAPVQLGEDEIGEALALIEAMTLDSLESPQITDHYTDALRAVIKAKQEARPLPKAPEPAARPGELVDLMAMLKQSVAVVGSNCGFAGQVDADRRIFGEVPGGMGMCGCRRPAQAATKAAPVAPTEPTTVPMTATHAWSTFEE